MGLLLNHLGVDGKGRLVFDAGDATVGDEDEEMDPADEDMVDLTALRSKLHIEWRRPIGLMLIPRIHPLYAEDPVFEYL